MSTITKNGLGRLLAVRLSPGEGLLEGIFSSCRQHGFRRAAVLSGIGSLKEVRIYNEGILSTDGENIIYGYGDQPRFWGGPQGVMELCSVKGTICTEEDGQPASGSGLHITFSNAGGAVLGGCLAKGTIVNLTAEIVIGELL